MTEIVRGHVYDYPKYYDLIFGSDWKAEFEFLQACFRKHARRPVRRVFEPACGTGRLLIRFAEAGYETTGNDLNSKAVDYCNARFRRRGFQPAAVVGDMTDFRLAHKADAAFNTINSFRHLASEPAAEAHLRCMARAISPGGLYVLGLHLTPTTGKRSLEESWSARRGHLAVVSRMWSERLDLKNRNEHFRLSFDVYTPTRHLRILDEMDYRTYTARQMQQLLANVRQFELVATYDFAYEIDHPITIGPETEDVLFVLRKR